MLSIQGLIQVTLIMIDGDSKLEPADFSDKLKRFWELSGQKIMLIEKYYDNAQGSPVFTVNGKYTTRGWTEWTRGFQFGSEVLHYDATGDTGLLQNAKKS